MSDRRFHPIAALFLSALTVALYAQTLDDEWHFDDLGELTPGVRSFAPAVGPTQYRGNAVLWLWAIDYRIGGEDPTAYHVTNGLLHLATSLVVYWLGWMLAEHDRRRRLAALAPAAVFCAHPLATQSVTYLTQRSTSSAALFFLLTLALWIAARRADGSGRWVVRGLALGAFVVGLHTKHVALLAPIGIAAYEVLFRPRPRRVGALLLVPFLLLGGWRALQYRPHFAAPETSATAARAAPASPRPGAFRPWTTREYALAQPRSIATYLGLFVFPRGQNLDRDVRPPRSAGEASVVGPLLLLAGLAAAGVLAARSRPRFAFGVFLFFLTVLPTSSVIRSPDLFFEHRAYLPMAGLCLALAPFAAAGRRPVFAWWVSAAVVAALSIATVRRNAVWDTELSLWTDTVAKSPDKARPRVNLGLALRNVGRATEAEREYRRALGIDAHDPFALNNLGTMLRLQGRPEEAEPLFRAAIAARPRYADPRINLGNLAMDRGDPVAAETWYREALELRPGSVPARFNLARSLERQGRWDEAVAEYARVAEERPLVASFRNDLGCARLAAGDVTGAERDLRRAVELDGDWGVAWYNLGLALEAAGRSDEAVRARARARELDPGLPPAEGPTRAPGE